MSIFGVSSEHSFVVLGFEFFVFCHLASEARQPFAFDFDGGVWGCFPTVLLLGVVRT
jgi:hypothetical protein